MSDFVNKLNEIKKDLDMSSDVAGVRHFTIDLIEALIEENQQLNKRINDLNISEVRGRIVTTNERIKTLEQKVEEHNNKELRDAHGTTRL